MKYRLSSRLKFMFQGQDAHAIGKNIVPVSSPFQDTMDLRMAYVEFGDAEKRTFALAEDSAIFSPTRS